MYIRPIPIEINPVTTCDDKQDKNLTRLEATLLEEKIDHILRLLEIIVVQTTWTSTPHLLFYIPVKR